MNHEGLDLKSAGQIPAYASLADLLHAVEPAVGFAPLGAMLRTAEELPPVARALLAHEDHMTVRLREHCGCDLALRVLRERRDDQSYVREILLLRGDLGRPVEFGIVRIHLPLLPGAAVREILEQKRPLGDILIAHDVLRRIEPRWFFAFAPGSKPSSALSEGDGGDVFGRLGVIHCDGRPAIEVLEVVRAEA